MTRESKIEQSLSTKFYVDVSNTHNKETNVVEIMCDLSAKPFWDNFAYVDNVQLPKTTVDTPNCVTSTGSQARQRSDSKDRGPKQYSFAKMTASVGDSYTKLLPALCKCDRMRTGALRTVMMHGTCCGRRPR